MSRGEPLSPALNLMHNFVVGLNLMYHFVVDASSQTFYLFCVYEMSLLKTKKIKDWMR